MSLLICNCCFRRVVLLHEYALYNERMAKRLFSKLNFLEEKPSDIDALGYENEIMHVKTRIDRLVKKKKHSIIAYLGPFGVGKSTILREVEKRTRDYKWVTFEMWRYSNRNELWDSFVIKLASELANGKDEFDVADEVEGTVFSRRESFLVLVWVLLVWLGLTFLSMMIWFGFRDGVGIGGQFWEAYFKYAAPTIVPILIIVGLHKFLQLDFITNRRPLRRVFELESLLFNKVKSMRKPLVVVVEDADRSSGDGAIFLETLNYFLGRLTNQVNSFIVIAPQSALVFEKQEISSYKGLETALKIYDEKIYFSAIISDESIDRFYDDLGVNPDYKDSIIQATKIIVGSYRRDITIRLLKHALREVNQFVEMNPGTNPVVALSIVLSRYVMVVGSISQNRQLAIKVLSGGNSHQSESAKPFFRAIAAGIDKYEEAINARTFTLNFMPDDVIGTKVTEYPNKSIQYDINIPDVYKLLFM